MFDSLFDLPLALVGSAIIGLLCIFALVGRAIFSRHVLPRLKHEPDESAFTGNMMQAVMIFYGLVVALTLEEFSDLIGHGGPDCGKCLANLY